MEKFRYSHAIPGMGKKVKIIVVEGFLENFENMTGGGGGTKANWGEGKEEDTDVERGVSMDVKEYIINTVL